jgi:anthranilate/para-aminobenzoate synthase component II
VRHALPAQYLGDLGCEHIVLKNDEKTVEEIAAMQPRGIMVSPGPGEGASPVAMHASA